MYYPIEQVARIDLIDRNQTTYWGTNLKGGIIAITMKKGKALAEAYAAAPSPDVSVVTPLGYQTPAEFYSPTYDTEEKRRTNTPDYRTTLYWNPVVKLDDLGQATVEFYTSDATDRLRHLYRRRIPKRQDYPKAAAVPAGTLKSAGLRIGRRTHRFDRI